MQYGPSPLFPRAAELPAGPPSDDAVLVTCAYLVEQSTPWVMQSLFLAAIGDARDRGAKALEAFAYRYPEGESAYERFLVHRTVFPRDFLADFGFVTVRAEGRVELARLELGGLAAGRRRLALEGAAPREGGVLAGPAAGAASLGRRPAREQQLGDLDRVQRGALAEVVAGEEEREPVLDGRVAADPADEHVVAARRLAGRREVLDLRTLGAAASSPRACSAESGRSVSTQTASACPTSTGTRTHVALIGSSGSSMIFRVSARSFDSSSNSTPSKSQSMRRSCVPGASASSRSIDCAPAPDTDW